MQTSVSSSVKWVRWGEGHFISTMLWCPFDHRFRMKIILHLVHSTCLLMNKQIFSKLYFSSRETLNFSKFSRSKCKHQQCRLLRMWSISCTHNPSLLEPVYDVEIQFPFRFRNAILRLPDKMETGKSYYSLNPYYECIQSQTSLFRELHLGLYI